MSAPSTNPSGVAQPIGTEPSDLDRLEALVLERRTHLLMDRDDPVPEALIERLCTLAMWAPNHKKTWPWRFAVCVGDGRSRLGEAFVDDMVAAGIGDEGKRTKTLTKFLRAPAVVVVGCAAHEHPTFHDENRDAVSAGIQNLLLGATAAGLASFWSTAPVIDGPRALSRCGFAPDDRIIGVIYLGWPTGACTAPERPPTPLTRITG